jgi:hypothetical protein
VDLLDEVLIMTVHPGFGGQRSSRPECRRSRSGPAAAGGGRFGGRGASPRKHGARCAAAGANVAAGRLVPVQGRGHRDAIAGMRWQIESARKAAG